MIAKTANDVSPSIYVNIFVRKFSVITIIIGDTANKDWQGQSLDSFITRVLVVQINLLSINKLKVYDDTRTKGGYFNQDKRGGANLGISDIADSMVYKQL